MKAILSINKKFMSFSPNELVNIIKTKSKSIEGVELYVNIHKRRELDYLIELVKVCKLHNLYFQVHGDSTLDIDEQVRYLKLLENVSDILGYKINVVLHPIVLESFDDSVRETINYFDNVKEKVDVNKLILSLENLNDFQYIDRLGINDVIPIAFRDDDIFLTYDLGHDIADNFKLTPLEDKVFYKLSNIHVHSVDDNYFGGGYDHKPIFAGDEYLIIILRYLRYLKSKEYDKSIVFEYDINACKGNNVEERLISYIKSIDYVMYIMKNL